MEIDGVRTYSAVQQAHHAAPKTGERISDDKADTTQSANIEKPAADGDASVVKQVSGDKNKKQEEEASRKMLIAAADSANKQLKQANRMLKVSVHEKTNRILVRVIDTESEEVVREIPPEKTLDLFAKMLEMAGLLLDEKR